MKEKYVEYSLYAKIPGHNNSVYSNEEALKDDKKRPLLLMSHNDLETFDKMTSGYLSSDDLLINYMKDCYGDNTTLYNLMFIKDIDQVDRSKSVFLGDIVFKEDRLNIEDKSMIQGMLEKYLKENPDKISDFGMLYRIYNDINDKYKGIPLVSLIEKSITKFFIDYGYMGYRYVYFKLKGIVEFPKRDVNNEIYR